MSLYISHKAALELAKLDSRSGIKRDDVISILHSMSDGEITNRADVHRLKGTNEDIYVLRHKDLRLFFTKRDNDVVFLSVTSRKG